MLGDAWTQSTRRGRWSGGDAFAFAAPSASTTDPTALKKAEIARMRSKAPAETTDMGRRAAAPRADAGSSEAIAAVKSDFADNMKRRTVLFQNTSVPSNFEALVSEFTPLQILKSETAELAEVLMHLADTSFPQFTDFRFTPQTWQGVEVDGSSAHVLVLGYVSYLRDGEWLDSDVVQFEANLAYEDGRWKYLTFSSIHPD